MGAEDMTKQDLFNQLKGLIIATEDRLAARTDKTVARLDGITSDFKAWRPRLEGRIDALQSAVAALQRQAATNVPPAEVPTPASSNPTDEVPAPAISDSDAKLVTIDVGGPAAPAPTTAPTEHMTTIEIVPVLAAPAATDGTLHGQAVSGVPSSPVTCSIVCLPRHPVATPVLVASSTPALPECVLDTNTILVAAVPLTMKVEFPAITTPTDSAPKVWLQQLYNGSEFFMPTSSLCITTKVHVHRPMPWPSFEDIHADGVEARPWPWPSFMEDYDCEAPRMTILKQSEWCSSDSSRAEGCAALDFQILEFYGNHFTSTGYIIAHGMCIFSELRCLDEMLLCLEYWWSTGNYVQSAHTTLVWPLYFIPGFPLRVIVRSFELRLFSNVYATIRVLLISLEGGNIAALSNEPDRHCCSSEVKESVVLNLPRNSSNYVLCDRLLLPLGNSGQQANATYYQFCCAMYTGLNYFGIQTGLHAFGKSTSSALMQGISGGKLMLQSLNDSGSIGSVSLVVLASSGYNTALTKSVISGLERLTVEGILLDLQDGRVDITKYNITIWSSTVFTRQACSVQPILPLPHAYQHSNFGWEQLVQSAHSFASGNLKCFPNTETVMYALVVASSEVMFMMAMGGGQRTFQGGRHMLATDQNKELRFPWDPGVTAAAWGQAAFQGGVHLLRAQQPYIQASIAPRANHKLLFKFYGPFQVLQRVSDTSYRIKLPEGSTVHPVFHVSLLRQALKPGTPVSQSLPDVTDNLAIPQKVLATRLRKKANQVVTQNLIKWSNGDEAAATWEDREEFRGRFPEAPAWGQAGSQGGGGVRVPIQTVPDQAQEEATDEATMYKQKPAQPVKPNSKYYGPDWQR